MKDLIAAAQQQEPVAWYDPEHGLPYGWTEEPPTENAVYLYAAPIPNKDAERYRWLRDSWWFCGPERGIRNALGPDELDAAIDAAMEKGE